MPEDDVEPELQAVAALAGGTIASVNRATIVITEFLERPDGADAGANHP
jgi:hypothetical protein